MLKQGHDYKAKSRHMKTNTMITRQKVDTWKQIPQLQGKEKTHENKCHDYKAKSRHMKTNAMITRQRVDTWKQIPQLQGKE